MFLEPIQKKSKWKCGATFLLKKNSLKIRDFETNILLSSLFFKFVQNFTHKKLKWHKLGHLVKSKTLHLIKGCMALVSMCGWTLVSFVCLDPSLHVQVYDLFNFGEQNVIGGDNCHEFFWPLSHLVNSLGLDFVVHALISNLFNFDNKCRLWWWWLCLPFGFFLRLYGQLWLVPMVTMTFLLFYLALYVLFVT